MGRQMRVLIGYDGSNGADAALADLKRAALPASVEAMVLSVADVYSPPPGEADGAAPPEWLLAAIERACGRVFQAVEDARATARRARERLQADFPEWTVHAEACAESPAWGLIGKAETWGANLIVVGSRGQSALKRLVLGSVAQMVLAHAPCSVRLAREAIGGAGAPVRLVVGVDGSSGAEAAVGAVASRTWPAGTAACLVTVVDPGISTALAPGELPARRWVGPGDADERAWIRRMVEAATERLRAAGIVASSLIREGDPKTVLVEEARRWGADCVFVGARGLRGLDRLLLGTVSAAVAARTRCSVEVVRG